jgi:hypothetical protein
VTVFVYALIIWSCFAAVSASTHMYFVFRSLSGREGAESMAMTRAHAARAGGMRKWIMINLAQDALTPWTTFQGLLIGYRGNRR